MPNNWTLLETFKFAGLDMDDLMGEGTTDANGEFLISGWNQEVSTIDPKLNIYHDCNDWIWVIKILKVFFSFLIKSYF